MAFILIQHLDPRHESRLVDLLSKATTMPVLEATHDLGVRPDHVYVIAPNTSLAVAGGLLKVTPRDGHGLHLPIDVLFRSLAQDQQARAVGVVLSGTDYAGRLEGDRAEVQALYHDLLINVTSFFRDPPLFEALQARVFPEIAQGKPPRPPVGRSWSSTTARTRPAASAPCSG